MKIKWQLLIGEQGDLSIISLFRDGIQEYVVCSTKKRNTYVSKETENLQTARGYKIILID